MDKVDVTLVGYGYWGEKIAEDLDSSNLYNLITIIDEDPLTQAKAIEKEWNDSVVLSHEIDGNFNVVDAVIIATPVDTHNSLAVKALESYCHVMVEKPLAESVKSARNIIACADAHQKKLSVGHVFRHSPEVQFIKNSLNKIGEPKFVHSRWENWGFFRDDVDVNWDLAVHPLSMYRYWFETEPEVEDVEMEDIHGESSLSRVTLSYGDVTAIIDMSWCHTRKVRQTTLSGSRGSIFYDDVVKDVDWYDEDREWIDGKHFKQFPLRRELEDFALSIINDREPKVTGQDGLAVVKTLEEIDSYAE